MRSVFLSALLRLLPVGCVILSACTGTKFLKENESFYTGAEIKLEPQEKVRAKRDIRNKLEEEILIKPNTTILGMRPGVWFYNVAGEPKKKKGLRSWIKRKLGNKPVLLRDATPEQTARILQGYLVNNGYFESTVSSAVSTKNKKSKVIYTVLLYPPFRLREIHYLELPDSVHGKNIKEVEKESYLKEGQRYSLERLQAEQERIEALLENHGFYYFDDQYLLFEADSTIGHRQVDLYLKFEAGIPPKAKRVYRFSEVNVYTDFKLSEDTVKTPADTLYMDGYRYIDKNDQFRPEVITDVINLKKGSLYTRDDHDYTLSHLMGLGAFKFVNIKYRESSSGADLLDADIYLTPLLKKSLRVELQAVSKSNNFVGPGLEVTFTNRNFLRGSERFELKVNTAYETQITNQQTNTLNSFELNVETSLSVPRFLSPIRINYSSRKYIPHTKFKLGFNLQKRISFFQLNSLNTGYGYTWRETTQKSHEFFPIDLNFVKLSRTSQGFQELLDANPLLKNSFQDQFIMGGRYTFTLNTQLKEDRIQQFGERENPHDFYLNANVGLAGNTIHWIQKRASSEEEPLQLFGQPYSQYVLGDVDFRYYWRMDSHNQLATRFIAGAGYAFGNSTNLPYIKQFAIGGTNSIRAFPARSVGPGSYNAFEDPNIENSIYFIDQRGDFKLEANMEYRVDIIGSFKGALFLDAGNIWLWREDESRPGGVFDPHTFLDQIAVGTGAGFRFDFRFFVLRFDVGFPLRRPDAKWVADEIDFGSATWRSNNLVYNIAIGYPF